MKPAVTGPHCSTEHLMAKPMARHSSPNRHETPLSHLESPALLQAKREKAATPSKAHCQVSTWHRGLPAPQMIQDGKASSLRRTHSLLAPAHSASLWGLEYHRMWLQPNHCSGWVAGSPAWGPLWAYLIPFGLGSPTSVSTDLDQHTHGPRGGSRRLLA